MATNKECLVIVLDVRTCAAEDFKLKSVKCVAEILKDKIVCSSKDYVSFVLVGSAKNTDDCQNVIYFKEGSVQLCSWQLLLDLFTFVNETACEQGEWLDGIKVALDMQENALALKPARRRILLLFDFNSMPQSYEKFNSITDELLNSGIELIVGSHNIAYIDNMESGEPQAIFNFSRKCTAEELENQKYALNLVPRCNATLCSFKETLQTVFRVTNRRPWSWNSTLCIGSKISINVQGMIAMKNQTPVKLKRVWAVSDEEVSRETHHFMKGAEVTPLPEDLMTGYMLGGTAVPYDDTLLEPKAPHPPGLHFFGFIKRDSVPDEYFSGDSLYVVAHQKGSTVSANKLDALVRALDSSNHAMLCWKIYSPKLNTPKMVILLPKLPDDSHPAMLYMLELSYTSQHHFWDFPSLRTTKSECSEEQLEAIDRLIDSTDLECSLSNTHQPRQWRQNDLLPFDSLPSIFEQNVMDVLERRVIKEGSLRDDDQQFKEMLKDKNFVDVFWSVPEALEEKSKQAASTVKKLFPLKHSRAWLEKLQAKEQAENALPIKDEPQEKEIPMPADGVGLVASAQDYTRILASIRSISNVTRRDAQFQTLAAQVRVVIFTLLERKKLNLEQLGELISLYRQSCLDFNAFLEYDKFTEELKKIVVAKRLQEFWTDIMDDKQLGPLVLGQPTLDDELNLKAYYNIDWQGVP
ncbi:GL15436 [Drosophila persimilis]|uniref:ATP-dependent DNA helicase II subunit 2 n=1 Tax=Drosophila persimilis TaxID=7234 RepID=B4HBZ6_DROPE|nr:uncharacterized protein LOC6603395 [Drosophila persimilis]EDW40007.1 GL15436 [Drosophila persimilis]